MPTRIKRYEERLDNLDDLLARIETEMGPEAQLEAREFRRNALMGIGGQRMVEIIATLQVEGERPQTVPVAGMPPTAARPAGENSIEELLSAVRGDSLELGARTAKPGLQPDDEGFSLNAASRLSEAFGRQASAVTTAGLLTPEQDDVLKRAWLDSLPGASSAESAAPLQSQSDDKFPASDYLPERQPVLEVAAMPPAPVMTEQERLLRNFAEQRRRQEAAARVEAATELTVTIEEPRQTGLAGLLHGDGATGRCLRHLLEWNIPLDDALVLLDAAQEHCGGDVAEADLLQGLRREVCRGVLLGGELRLTAGERRVVALVGPTGVGKTTTIAKLAARAVFEKELRVAVLSLDNYRIAAVEQLRSYAEIMGIRCEVAFSAQEYTQILAELEDYDLVLVDTAGRAAGRHDQISEAAELLSAAPPDEVLLVLAAGTMSADIAAIVEGFSPLGLSGAVLSKLDETSGLGGLYNLSRLCNLPLSYVTTGQSVPEDIRPADPEYMNELINQGASAE